MKKLIFVMSTVTAIAFLVVLSAQRSGAESANAVAQLPATTNVMDGVNVTSASTLISAGDSRSVGCEFCNPGASNVFLAIGQAAVVNKGLVLFPGKCKTLPYPTVDPVYGIVAASGYTNVVTYSRGAR